VDQANLRPKKKQRRPAPSANGYIYTGKHMYIDLARDIEDHVNAAAKTAVRRAFEAIAWAKLAKGALQERIEEARAPL
jgi:hypothetical protein